jgi:hypothetical protein
VSKPENTQTASSIDSVLDALFDSDVDGLLDAPEKPKKVTSSDRLERAFLEIVEYRREHGRNPSSTTREIAERKLGARLDGILANQEKIDALKHLDEFELLTELEAPASLDELLESDDLDLLDDDTGILDVSSLPARKSPVDEFDVARRKKSADFKNFEQLFKTKHAELADGTYRLIPFPGVQTIVEGAFFVLGGIMLFVAEVGETQHRVVGGKQEQKQRLRVIFENGTESSLYRQSLSIRLHEQEGFALARTGHDLSEIGDADIQTGYVYVLRSLSDDPQIADVPDLYKIGFSRGPVEKRVARAEHESTYLMAPVQIIANYRTYNLRTSSLEHLLHRVFAAVRLRVSLVGMDGRTYEPSEWFSVPLPVINQAIDLITSGDIVRYVYDATAHRLVERS